MMCFKSIRWIIGAGLISLLTAAVAWGQPVQPVYPETYGAVADGVYDCTSAIQQAYDTGNNVILSIGTYRITAPIFTADLNPDPSQRIQRSRTISGSGAGSTVIKQSTMNSEILHNTDHLSLSNLTLKYDITQESRQQPGAIAINSMGLDSTGSSSCISNIRIENAYIGIAVTGFASDGMQLSNITVYNCIENNLLIYSGGGVLVSNFSFINKDDGLYNGDPEYGTLGAIRFLNQVEGVILTNGHIFGGNYSMTTDGSYVVGYCPNGNKFSNVFFDSAYMGTSFNNCMNMDFIHCWFSGGRGGNTNGVDLLQTVGLKFLGGEVVDCGAAGINIGAQTVDLIMDGLTIQCNSVKSGNGVKPGINVAAGARGFQIVNCAINNNIWREGLGLQDPGIRVEPGDSNDYIISHNRLAGTTTGMIDGGTSTYKIVKDNLGYTSRNAGVYAITTGTKVVVSHGLEGTPPLELIRICTLGDWYTIGLPWVSDVTSTTFTVNCHYPVGGAAWFNWSAALAGEERLAN